VPKKVQSAPTVTETTERTTKVTWPENTDQVDGYVIEVSNSVETRTIRVPRDQTSREVTGLTPGTDYTVKVYGVKNGIKGTPSEETTFSTVKKGMRLVKTNKLWFYKVFFTIHNFLDRWLLLDIVL